MKFERAYILQKGDRKFGREEVLVRESCERAGIEVVPYLAKQMQRRQLRLTGESFICGDMDTMGGAMKQLGIEVPVPNDFPESLAPFLERRVWRGSLGGLGAMLEGGCEVFAKPAGRRKVFTGRVFSSPSDLYFVSGVSRNEPVWFSEVVDWLSEFRVYVIHGEIVAVVHYGGDAAVAVSEPALVRAIASFTASGEAPAAYGIDFGVLRSGATALVEANDGYALGAYEGIGADDYTRLLFTRWSELLHGATQVE